MNDDASVERDIKLVLITGAGATHEFGINGTKIPMMREWSDSLVAKLGNASGSYIKATGLVPGLDGPEFEKRLGTFLRQIPAFKQIESLLKPSLGFPSAGQTLMEQSLSGWYSNTQFHLSEISDLIRKSLYDNFSSEKIDLDASACGYSRLLKALGIGNTDSLVYATTNYDAAGEYAIQSFGGIPDWGAPRLVKDSSQRLLRVERILEGLPRYVPVLHLHGRIGWYIRPEDGKPYSLETSKHDKAYGVPIVLLPDPQKEYDSQPVIRTVWEQFEEALKRANRVFVLGHSLSDQALMDSLLRNIEPLSRLAVGVLADKNNPDSIDPTAASLEQKVRTTLPSAQVLPIRFGREPKISPQGLEDWPARSRKIIEGWRA